jgi:predicted transcriptional regulator of viral defense system
MESVQEVSLRDLPDLLIARGRYSASLEEIRELTGLTYAAIASGMQRLRKQRRVFSPTRGLYVVIPPEYRSWGVVPADWFIDALMNHLGRRYYVALLSAAAYHGAAHQAPQVFQTMADGRVLDRAFGRVRMAFYSSEHVTDTPTETVTMHTGSIPVSSREATVVDLTREPRASGGVSNVATILTEIGELDGSTLATLAARHGRSLARRTGWMVDRYGSCRDLGPLRLAAMLDLGEPALLSPSGPRRGRTDRTWRVRMNIAVEPDLATERSHRSGIPWYVTDRSLLSLDSVIVTDRSHDCPNLYRAWQRPVRATSRARPRSGGDLWRDRGQSTGHR